MKAEDALDRIFRAMRERCWSSPPPMDEELAQVEAQARRHFRPCDFCGQISLSRILKSREPWNYDLVGMEQFGDDLWVCEGCLK